jgi:hypothetical protein
MKCPKKSVSLEDLLRVKRAEQPPPSFWTDFDRELRAKQLAAIVEPRPWWAPFIRLGARASRFQLPVGAVAILAISFVTIREYRAPVLDSSYVPQPSAQAPSTPTLPQNVAADLASPEHVPASDAGTSRIAVVQPVIVTEAEEPALEAPASNPRALAMMDSAAINEPSPSAQYIAANLAAVQSADPSLVDDLFGPSMRRVPVRQPVRDPLSQVNAPGESRRSRLLATALPVSATASELEVGTKDRLTRKLTEDRLYDTISRVGVQGDRVAIKF